ncbi:MAG: hypothetical protein E7129_04335 [Rikenellaceae bacterium]|nr:hypothetical protein [Rikenellaceae bacterium]
MKRIFVLLAVVATLFAQDAFAQGKPQATDEQKAAAKEKREQLMQTRLELLKTELELSDEQFAKFDPVYRKFRQEIQRVTSMNKDARMKKDQITNDNALRVVSARLANQVLTATVKQRYLMIFAEVIEPVQVMKLYRVDEKVSRKASEIMKYRSTAATMDSKTAK